MEHEWLFNVRIVHGAHFPNDVGELTRTTTLLFVFVVEFHHLCWGLAVTYFGSTDFHLNFVFATNSLNINIEMQFAHSSDDHLVGFLIGEDAEGWVLFTEALKRFAEFVRRTSIGGSHSHLDDRVWDKHVFEGTHRRRRGVSVTTRAVDSHDGDNVAGLRKIDLFTLVGVHSNNPTESFGSACTLVVVGFAFADRSLVESHERQLAKGIVHNLKCHADKRLLRIRGQLVSLVGIFVVLGVDFTLQGRGQKLNDPIEQRLYALVLECGSHVYRRQLEGLNRFPDDGVDQLFANRLTRQKEFHHFVAVHRERLKHLLTRGFGVSLMRFRNIGFNDVLALLAFKLKHLHFGEVDHTFKLFAGADVELHQHGIATQLVPHLLDHFLRVGTRTVHFVDEGEAGNFVSLHLAIDGDGLCLHTTYRT